MATSSKTHPLVGALPPTAPECAPGERRRWMRRATPASPPAIELGTTPGFIVDLSEGGMRVQAPAAVRVSPEALLRFQVPDSTEQVAVHCAMAWADESGNAGLRFLAFSGTGRAELTRWLAGAAPVVALPPMPRSTAEAEMRPVKPEAPSLEQIVRKMMVVTAAEGAAIALRRDQQVVCRASAGNAPEVGTAVNPESGLSGECLRSGQPVLCPDTERDARVSAEVCRQLRLRSAVLVPVLSERGAEGVLEVFSSKANAFDRGDLLALVRLSDVVAAMAAPKKYSPPEPEPPRADEPVAQDAGGGRPALQETVAEEPAIPTPTAGAAEKLPAAHRGVVVCDGCGHPNPEWASCCERCDIPLRIPGVAAPPVEPEARAPWPVWPRKGRDDRRPATKLAHWSARALRHGISLASLTVPLSYFAYFLLGPVIRTESLQGTAVLGYMRAVVEPGMELANYFFAFRGVVHGWNFMFVIVGVLTLFLRYLALGPVLTLLRRVENMTRARKPLPLFPYVPHRTEFR